MAGTDTLLIRFGASTDTLLIRSFCLSLTGRSAYQLGVSVAYQSPPFGVSVATVEAREAYQDRPGGRIRRGPAGVSEEARPFLIRPPGLS